MRRSPFPTRFLLLSCPWGKKRRPTLLFLSLSLSLSPSSEIIRQFQVEEDENFFPLQARVKQRRRRPILSPHLSVVTSSAVMFRSVYATDMYGREAVNPITSWAGPRRRRRQKQTRPPPPPPPQEREGRPANSHQVEKKSADLEEEEAHEGPTTWSPDPQASRQAKALPHGLRKKVPSLSSSSMPRGHALVHTHMPQPNRVRRIRWAAPEGPSSSSSSFPAIRSKGKGAEEGGREEYVHKNPLLCSCEYANGRRLSPLLRQKGKGGGGEKNSRKGERSRSGGRMKEVDMQRRRKRKREEKRKEPDFLHPSHSRLRRLSREGSQREEEGNLKVGFSLRLSSPHLSSPWEQHTVKLGIGLEVR